MNRKWAGLIGLASIAVLWFVFFASVRFDSDFIAMYAAVRGAVNGISPYDHVGQAALLTEAYELDPPMELLPFGYPPWYVALVTPLGWLSFGEAGRAFMLLNTAWFLLGTACLIMASAEHLSARLKAGLMLVAALYLPLIGLVVIGQYVMPVYAGLGVCVLGLVRKHPWMLAAGLWLLSFKWHIGAIPGLAALLLAATYGRAFLVQAVGNTLVIVLLASCVGLLLDPRWPVTYAQSVLALSVADVNQVCDTCSSLAWTLTTRLDAGSSWGSGALLLVLGAAAMAAQRVWRHPDTALAATLCLTLAALPYVRNYDFAVFAFAWLVGAVHARGQAERGVMACLWLAPLALPLVERDLADLVLGVSALVLFVILLRRPGAATAA